MKQMLYKIYMKLALLFFGEKGFLCPFRRFS